MMQLLAISDSLYLKIQLQANGSTFFF